VKKVISQLAKEIKQNILFNHERREKRENVLCRGAIYRAQQHGRSMAAHERKKRKSHLYELLMKS